jgi:twitching motility protein PilT
MIVIGEIRGADTISTVLGVTDSGHRVISTMHTSSSVETIQRLIAEFQPHEQERIRYRIADVLKVIISQKLVPTKKGNLILAKEIFSSNTFIQAAIRNNNFSDIFQMITDGKDKGMFTLQQDLYKLYKQGIITAQTAMQYANNRNVMGKLLQY